VAVKAYDLEIDEWNAEEMARHGVMDWEIRQVLDNRPVFSRNKGKHAAPVIMIGPTESSFKKKGAEGHGKQGGLRGK